jgi:hypothetical protein
MEGLGGTNDMFLLLKIDGCCVDAQGAELCVSVL